MNDTDLKKIITEYNSGENTDINEDELFTIMPTSVEDTEKISAPRYSYWKSVFRVFFRKKSNWIALGLLIIILFFTYVYSNTYTFNLHGNILNSSSWNLSPSETINRFGFSVANILGTGQYGESLFQNVWVSARTSLSLAFICAAINMSVGVVVGAIWGFSKTVDKIMMEVYNIIANVPYILFISVLVMVLGSGFWQFVAALTITGWLGTAYFIRTQVIIIRDREYNLASRCLGTGIWKMTTKNILPFLTSVIVTIIATEVPSYISYEVFLSFIGIGLSADQGSLGRLIEQGQQVMAVYPYQFWAPVAVASSITIILYVVGQNLADASDPRTHM